MSTITAIEWKRGDTVPWEGTRMILEVFAGLFWDDGDGLGIYFAKDGIKHYCSRAVAVDLARRDRLPLACRNRYQYHPLGKRTSDPTRQSQASQDVSYPGKMSVYSYGTAFRGGPAMLIHRVLKDKVRRLITIGPDATVMEALALFVEHNIGSLPVVSASGKVIGIFTERDVLYGDHRDPEHFHRELIRDVMTPNPITCSPDDAVHAVMGRMSQNKVGQLPVVDAGKLVGLVSVGDLIKSLYDQAEASNQHLTAFLYGPG
jgi:CBS domain-containing protein